ncbi:MAG: chemotaxis response regulator protein-glutamate methylesterase [Ponticaulis sp.]|nr:chemotaxis response regulator protein-glutamate methylesterase [Ponticaulis sp.]|tara:strand:- start:8070 stop:9212 length:1143 start_codon:yes stop_codon:yes gene_type:complete
MSVVQSPRAQNRAAIRVQLIDDSAVVRGLTRRWLTGLDDIELIVVSADGMQGVADAIKHKPDIIILDVEMPRMDGLEALPHLRRAAPKAKIIMASTLTHKGANVTIQALSKGATDYLPKPDSSQLGGADAYRDALIGKVRVLGRADEAARPSPAPIPLRPQSFQPNQAPRPAIQIPSKPELRKPPLRWTRPNAIVVASSTGGPQALQALLPELCRKTDLPILVVQHMPPTFTSILADHLNATCSHTVKEGEKNEPVQSKHIYIAPGGFHMTVDGQGASRKIGLNEDPQVNFCRPAADVLFNSAARTYGAALTAVVLTGMGADGCQGVATIVDQGGRSFVQDQETSVVWGMPGAVFNSGLAHSIHPLKEIAEAVGKSLHGV